MSGNNLKLDLTEKKVCTKCGEEKLKYVDFELAYKKSRGKSYPRPQCRKCRSKSEVERRQNDGGKWKEYTKNYRAENKDKIKANYEAKRDYYNNYKKQYREIHKEEIAAHKKEYYQREDVKQKRNEKSREQRLNDPIYCLICNIRTRVHNVLKQNKNNTTYEFIGCTKDQLIKWLQSQFTGNMTWENYGSYWHVDHVIPLIFFNLEIKEEQFLAFNWCNLQPMIGIDNLSKNDSIIKEIILKHMYKVIEFISNNEGYHANMETCWPQRLQLWYGENPKDDEEYFKNLLKWAIRIEDASTSDDLSNIMSNLKI